MLLLCHGCGWGLKPDRQASAFSVTVERYDRLESLYLTTGDRSAIQQMNTSYPMQTRTLIEDVLRIGKVDDSDINGKFLHFFQDSVLQQLVHDVQQQYSDMDDLNEELTEAFGRLKHELPFVSVPRVYAQIGSFDQSIIVGINMLGISLDKYLGADYPFYIANYSEQQRRLMTRSMIVPDCISFFLLSIYPLPYSELPTKAQRDLHMGKIQWVVNQITGKRTFQNSQVAHVDRYMKQHKQLTIDQLLSGGMD